MHSMAHMPPMMREREMEKEGGREEESVLENDKQERKENRLNDIDENEGKDRLIVHHRTRIKWTKLKQNTKNKKKWIQSLVLSYLF